jgi:quinol monooxygenase YgiN
MTRIGTLVSLLLLAAPAAVEDHPVITLVKPKLKDPAKPFTLVVTFKVKDGAGDTFEKQFKEAAAASKKEAGNLAYQLNRDADDPGTYLVYERWKTLDALKAHTESDHFKKIFAALPDLVAGQPGIKVMTPADE